jgi:hypothetical protein
MPPSLPEPSLNPGRLQRAGRTVLRRARRLGERLWRLATTRLAGFHAQPGRDGTARPPLPASRLAGQLAAEKEFLLALLRNIETEFLATGDELGRLSQQLNEIQQECQSLTDLTLGRTPDAAAQFAFQLLKKAEDLVLASYDQYDHVFTTFAELEQRLTQLAKQLNELMRVLLPLNFITMSFRIEASRHPPEVQLAFFTLADNMNRTVNEVRGMMERQLHELETSERIARSLMQQISVSIHQHRRAVADALQTSRRQLQALSEALINSGAEATGLARLNKTVSQHIGGIVVAQQCQDIARQRIEHVGEAMEEMRHQLEVPAAASLDDRETRRFVSQAGQVQLHQVQDVFNQLNGAASALKGGIQGLRTETGSAAEVVVKLGGATLEANLASQCQAGIGQILDIVKQAVHKIADIIAAFEPLQASFMDCTSKAAVLASDVRHAGLNAQVFAIRTPNGATLEVLAGRANAISEEVIQQVGELGAALNQSMQMISNLRQRLEDFQQLGQAEQDILADESVTSQHKLAELEHAIPQLIQRVTQLQGAIAQSVDGTLATIQFPATITQASSRSLGFFRDLVAWGGEGAEPEAGTHVSQKTDSLQSRYTMSAERQAHAAALQSLPAEAAEASVELFADPAPPAAAGPGAPAENLPAPVQAESSPASLEGNPTPAPGSPPAKKNASEMGDNVELF